MNGTHWRSGTVAKTVAGGAAALLIGLFGCSLSTGPGSAPTDAHIIVDGTTTPLDLVVSTDFYEVQDTTTAQIHQVFNSSQTVTITPPYDKHWPFNDQARIAVHLQNNSGSEVTVHMQIVLDNGGQGYDHNATLPAGQELVYVYVFNQSVF